MSDTKRMGDFSDFLGFTKRNNPDLHQRLNKIGRKPFLVKRSSLAFTAFFSMIRSASSPPEASLSTCLLPRNRPLRHKKRLR